MPTPASTVLRRLAYTRVANRIANDLEYQLRQGWTPYNVYLCRELTEEAGRCADYYNPEYYWRDEGYSWNAACRRAFAALQADWPEFALFKPKHKHMGEQWFGDGRFCAKDNTERRLLVLAFCIAMTEKP